MFGTHSGYKESQVKSNQNMKLLFLFIFTRDKFSIFQRIIEHFFSSSDWKSIFVIFQLFSKMKEMALAGFLANTDEVYWKSWFDAIRGKSLLTTDYQMEYILFQKLNTIYVYLWIGGVFSK